MSKYETKAMPPLLEAITSSKIEWRGWSRDELIELESSWGPSRNPTAFVDGLIDDEDLVKVGVDEWGRTLYQTNPRFRNRLPGSP